MEIKRGLRRDFDANYYRTREDATEACKYLCYSDLHCQWWLYTTDDGCWVEDPPNNEVPYPLTQSDIDTNSDFASKVIAGEYIQHRCPEHDGKFTSADERTETFSIFPWNWNWFGFHWPWDPPYWPWWMWFLSFTWCCCCCFCCVLMCGCLGLCKKLGDRFKKTAPQDDKKKKKKSDDSDSDSASSYSSDSDDDKKSKKASKQALLQGQQFNSLAQGTGHQVLHSNAGYAGYPGR